MWELVRDEMRIIRLKRADQSKMEDLRRYHHTYWSTSIDVVVVRPSFPMMTITSSMMMMMSCLVDPVSAEVANQSNSGLQHSSTLGAWVCRAG